MARRNETDRMTAASLTHAEDKLQEVIVALEAAQRSHDVPRWRGTAAEIEDAIEEARRLLLDLMDIGVNPEDY